MPLVCRLQTMDDAEARRCIKRAKTTGKLLSLVQVSQRVQFRFLRAGFEVTWRSPFKIVSDSHWKFFTAADIRLSSCNFFGKARHLFHHVLLLTSSWSAYQFFVFSMQVLNDEGRYELMIEAETAFVRLSKRRR